LNAAFGIGQWALKPIGGFIKTQKSNYGGKTQQTVCREYAMYISGKFAASAIGEATYIEENMQMTWSDACEATKSNAIMRCCKDIGIGLEMWDRKFTEQFKKEHCVCVFRKGSPKPHWRLKDSEPFHDEAGKLRLSYRTDREAFDRLRQEVSRLEEELKSLALEAKL